MLTSTHRRIGNKLFHHVGDIYKLTGGVLFFCELVLISETVLLKIVKGGVKMALVNRRQMSISLPPELIQWVNKQTKIECRTKGLLIEKLLREYQVKIASEQ